jgi:hypothetical protein
LHFLTFFGLNFGPDLRNGHLSRLQPQS